MSEPRTEAGRRLLLAIKAHDFFEAESAILAIEAEAALAAEPETGLRAAAWALLDALPYEPGSMLGGKIALLFAALDAKP